MRAQSETPRVVPGITVRAAQPRGTDTVVYQRLITRAGKDTMAGTRTVVSRLVDGPDRTPLLEVEQRFPAGGTGFDGDPIAASWGA